MHSALYRGFIIFNVVSASEVVIPIGAAFAFVKSVALETKFSEPQTLKLKTNKPFVLFCVEKYVIYRPWMGLVQL